MPRGSALYLGGTALLTLFAGALLLHALHTGRAAASMLSKNRRLVRELALTDLCLFTEASYTRHPSLTDLATPFQDAPLSLEHFPTGSLLAPPYHLANNHVTSP